VRSHALGIRLQIVLALGGLLVVAFVPLFFAVVSLTRGVVHGMHESTARALVRGISVVLSEGPAPPSSAELAALLDRHAAAWGVSALATFDAQGHLVSSAGDPTAQLRLLEPAARSRTALNERGAAMAVSVPTHNGSLAALVSTEDDAAKSAPLLRLLAAYTVLFGFGLLTFAYIALTRLIVRPLDAISRAARRVADGARVLEVPERGPRELLELGFSVSQMTATLLANEGRMREQIEELERRARKLRDAQDRLIRSERLASVGKLSAGLAHEIGNPIAALLGLLDLLLQGDLSSAEQHDFMLRMRVETERIHRVLRDLLDFARPGSAALGGPQDAEPEGLVQEAVADVLALLKPQPAFRDLTLDVELAPELPAVTLSHERLMQVLLNLLLNAADAAPHGHVTLAVLRLASQVRISVEDDGPGIDPAIRERLFEPFATTKEIGKGTGLGLAVCRGLVESASGSINVESSSGRGARFVVELPIAARPSSATATATATGSIPTT
jgi:two-component system NtrC family sensor kinase